jgi:CRP-like cAMP-binding protein
MVGGSRESVNRILADFAARGLLHFERDTLVVPDPGRLTAEARG